MLATFSLRLACGLAGSLLLLPPGQVNPRFYRTQFLVVLGFAAVALMSLRGSGGAWLWVCLWATLALSLLGALAWSLEGAPGGRWLVGFTTASLVGCLAALVAGGSGDPSPLATVLADQLTSAAFLGTATTAMLVGHSYLIAPSMSLTPLLRLLNALFATTFLRVLVAGLGLWSWTAGHSLVNLKDETVLWLPLRWVLGFAGPLVLAWMAREAAKIRSTQSATGILYVAVIFCFLGELTSQLLLRNTGYPL
jgi:hypothetical protein